MTLEPFQDAYYARSETGLVASYYQSFNEGWATPYWRPREEVRTVEDVQKLMRLPDSTRPEIVPCQEIGPEYEAIKANAHAAVPPADEMQGLNFALICDVFSAKQRAYLSRLKSSASWTKYKGKLHYELQISGFELFTMKYYGIFFLPSMLECQRVSEAKSKYNCVLEMDYEGLTLQGSTAIWISPYHIFEILSVESTDDIIHVQLTSRETVPDSRVKRPLSDKLEELTKRGSMPLDHDVTAKQVLLFSSKFPLH